jgi:hypothetical protein
MLGRTGFSLIGGIAGNISFGGTVNPSKKSWTKILAETLAPLLLGIDYVINFFINEMHDCC